MTKVIRTCWKSYMCTVCGGNGIDPRQPSYGTVTPQCPNCGGTGIMRIEETTTWDDDLTGVVDKVFGQED